MIKRYANSEIIEVWSDWYKLKLWQNTELAVIKARANLGEIAEATYNTILEALSINPIDLNWWLARENEIRHDLQAFVEERQRYLSPEFQIWFHKELTSYDTEEPAFGRMLKVSIETVNGYYNALETRLIALAKKYRYTPMMARTHGQEAELQSFGRRCLTWLASIRLGAKRLEEAAQNLKYSKLSGAIGNYGGISPELEKEALAILGFEPFYGATQIMPRELYLPIAQALCQIALTLDKIATDIRLGARSGRPIFQEPFGKKQKGSSAMPHKKNTISTEKIAGMARLAKGCCAAIQDNINTWEERAIEQSSVERVAWPDLFHVTIHSLVVMERVVKGLRVYPDKMLLEIIDTRGCYAAAAAKELLKEVLTPYGLDAETAYHIVQLASFNVLEAPTNAKCLRANPPKSLEELEGLHNIHPQWLISGPNSIHTLIANGILRTSPSLATSEDCVLRWNKVLSRTFCGPGSKENRQRLDEIFSFSYHLRNEKTVYQAIIEQ